MPRTLQEILDHADDLARRFEDYEPHEEDRVTSAEIELRRLQQAAVARARAERGIAEAVRDARAEGVSWSSIGQALGTSAQAAQKRYRDTAPKSSTRRRVDAKSRSRRAS